MTSAHAGGAIAVKLSRRLTDWADEKRHAELPRISISARNHQPRGLAVPPRACRHTRLRTPFEIDPQISSLDALGIRADIHGYFEVLQDSASDLGGGSALWRADWATGGAQRLCSRKIALFPERSEVCQATNVRTRKKYVIRAAMPRIQAALGKVQTADPLGVRVF